MIDKQLLTQVIDQALEGTPLFLVEVTVSADNVVDVAIDSMGDVSLDDCVRVNNAVLAAFDRDRDDFQLTVGSYGISEPFKVHQHYQKNLGGEVEVLTADGRKLKGTLKSTDDQGFILTRSVKERPEGKKRPVLVDHDEPFGYNDIKYIKNIISV